MSTVNEKLEKLKPWQANLIVFGLELLQIIIYVAIAGKAFKNGMKGNLGGMFDDVIAAIWFLNLSALAIAAAVFYFKPLRTKNNLYIAWWNVIWVVSNLYFIYG